MSSNHLPSQQPAPQPVARFDRLGLPMNSSPSTCSTAIGDVAFQILRLKRLLESAFQLEGFDQATASSCGLEPVVVAYAASEGLYHSFNDQPLAINMQIKLTQHQS